MCNFRLTKGTLCLYNERKIGLLYKSKKQKIQEKRKMEYKQRKCNVCGGVLEEENGVWHCPYCGARYERELSEEETILLSNASARLRMQEFQEAEELFFDVMKKYPDTHEAYWGYVCARYGIKYEEDYNGKMIPTCCLDAIDSFEHDKEFLRAVELAPEQTQKWYLGQAEYIKKISEKWLKEASKEEPYDIFICFKDSDKEKGIERTQDSRDASDLYSFLTSKGYRVFFSRVSLADKTGEKYEPYIFNALQTAKVLLVFGESVEYINSTWVKNEWHRYCKRMANGEKKENSLVVVYKGFEPSELPSILSKKQCLKFDDNSFYLNLLTYLNKVLSHTTEESTQVQCPKCGATMRLVNNQFVCPNCNTMILNIMDTKIDSDVMVMSPNEFAKKIEKGKKRFVVNIHDKFEVFDVETKIINKKIADATAMLEQGNFDSIKNTLDGVPDTVLSAERLRYLSAYEVRNEFELSSYDGYVEPNKHYENILKLADEQTSETYRKIASYCREQYDTRTKIKAEIEEVNGLLKVQLYDDALVYAKEMCRKYPQTMLSWSYLCQIKQIKDRRYNCDFEYGMMKKCIDYSFEKLPAFLKDRIEKYRSEKKGKFENQEQVAKFFVRIVIAVIICTGFIIFDYSKTTSTGLGSLVVLFVAVIYFAWEFKNLMKIQSCNPKEYKRLVPCEIVDEVESIKIPKSLKCWTVIVAVLVVLSICVVVYFIISHS